MKTGNNHKISDAHKVFETECFSIDSIPYRSSNSQPYYRLSCNDSVSIIAKTINGEIILIRQYRPAIEAFALELPSGYIDKGKSSEDAVKRELTEETDFVCDSVVYMGLLKIFPSRINNTLHVFFGKDAKLRETKENKDMKEELTLVSQKEFKKLIIEGKYIETTGIAMYQ